MLFMTSGLDEETEAEAKLWRGKLLEKEEEEPYLFAQSFAFAFIFAAFSPV